MSRSDIIALLQRAALVAVSLVNPCVLHAQNGNEADSFKTKVRAITSGSTSADRMSNIATLLDNQKVPYQVKPFGEPDDEGGSVGKNLQVAIGVDNSKSILLGAHFDQVNVGQGAVDNACSCAVLLELIVEFTNNPLTNFRLDIVFFDKEEVGLLGSKAYVEALGDSRPDHFINLDIFGYGDAFWLMSEEEDSPLVSAFRAAGKKFNMPIHVDNRQAYPPGDHIPFVEAKIPTLAVALIDEAEIPQVRSLLQGERIAPPPILRTIHTPDDTIAKIEPAECAEAYPIVAAAIRWLDSYSRQGQRNE